MTNVLTLYFAGSGHGKEHTDDAIVDAYKKTTGPKVFFPGPGGADTNIYSQNTGFIDDSQERVIGQNYKSSTFSSAKKRGATGKGWNRNVWYALRHICDFLKKKQGNVTLNFAGHSRGSITIIMLLNDILHENVPLSQRQGFEIASLKTGTKTFDGDDDTFAGWYEERLKKTFAKRMGSDRDAEEGIHYLKYICARKDRLECNVWLFDPVGGLNQGHSTRKQEFPEHPIIKRARVMRMETGGAGGTLSTNMPTFKGKHNWVFLSGDKKFDLTQFKTTERLVIPMPGSHGAGLSENVQTGFFVRKRNKGKPKTAMQRYIGRSYMVSMLRACGTTFARDFDHAGDSWTTKAYYDALMEEFIDEKPEGGRKAIHAHHSFNGKKGSYLGGAVNAHHRYLQEMH